MNVTGRRGRPPAVRTPSQSPPGRNYTFGILLQSTARNRAGPLDAAAARRRRTPQRGDGGARDACVDSSERPREGGSPAAAQSVDVRPFR
ncbi:hypothetical protein EVAR_102242_1 [Eumeta japonica]|uniref:Uncharacterized protein n=1 Tax=Eumeta variegata TaxID=151549 RepID=A0A4C1WFY0_EUMVA|nr:hypothetical protein EVAR_102242_1 [Eumeta japonica]